MDLQSDIYHIPALYCPISPAGAHPGAEEMEKRSMAWLERFGVAETEKKKARLAGTKSNVLMSMITPGADPSLVQLGVDWSYLAFGFDDRRTDHGATSHDTRGLVRWLNELQYCAANGESGSNDPFHRAIADLSARIRGATSRPLWRRWLSELRATCWAAGWESAHRTGGTVPSFNEFLAVRAPLAMGWAQSIHAEISLALEVPEHERVDPRVQAVMDAAWLLVGLDDDLYSFPKEDWDARNSGRDPLREPSAVPILMHEKSCGPTKAMEILAGVRNQIMKRTLEVLHEVESGTYRRDTKTVARLAVEAVRANLDWALTASRYTDPGGGHLKIDLPVSEDPPTCYGKPEYPFLSSWWPGAP